MQETRVLLVFPGSLFGGRWADGPRVKPELVQLFTELRRAGYEADVLDLEAELGNPGDDVARESFLQIADGLLAEREADLVVVSCWSALQYSAAMAVAERVRRQLPDAVIAACGHHVSVRPDDFNDPGAPFDWLIAGEAETAVLTLAAQVAAGERETGGCHSLEGTPLPLDSAHLPDYAAYPYTAEGLPELGLFLSRGCPYNAPACLLRPGGRGLARLSAGRRRRRPSTPSPPCARDGCWSSTRRSATRPAGGAPCSTCWRPATGATSRSASPAAPTPCSAWTPTSSTGRGPASCSRWARSRRRCSGAPARRRTRRRRWRTRSSCWSTRAPRASSPAPGSSSTSRARRRSPRRRRSTRSSASSLAVPNTSVTIDAQPWAYLPISEEGADVDAPASRFGTRIAHPEWWKERVDAHTAATAVVASHELAGRAPGDESYWRPRFEELREALAAKLTADARRGLRSHETVGSGAYGVPHGWWTEPRWH